MEKKLSEMSIFELFSFRENVDKLIEYYSKQLTKYGITDMNQYYNELTESEKNIINLRLKIIKLRSDIIANIEEKMKFYYD